MFKCDICGTNFKDFKNGGYIKNLVTHCPKCSSNKEFTININGITIQTSFVSAMNTIKNLK